MFQDLITKHELDLLVDDVRVIKDVFDLFDIDENEYIDKIELKYAFEIVGPD